mmetsp:Transcript_37398/g.89388  ORF Transcript_37398/g.89388 Transcript_37398/m.89388 type:complete len:107 (+) Transcript_37398:647-967(+)
MPLAAAVSDVSRGRRFVMERTEVAATSVLVMVAMATAWARMARRQHQPNHRAWKKRHRWWKTPSRRRRKRKRRKKRRRRMMISRRIRHWTRKITDTEKSTGSCRSG